MTGLHRLRDVLPRLQVPSNFGVSLRRLTADHIKPLAKSLYSPTGFFELPHGLHSVGRVEERLENQLRSAEAGMTIPLVLSDKNGLRAVSSYLSADEASTRVEIGFTFIAPTAQQSAVNSKLKWLMLECWFGLAKLKRVEFLVDPLNTKSNTSIVKIGAQFEGCLRAYRTNYGGTGDRNVYSIRSVDWPEVSPRLLARIARLDAHAAQIRTRV